MLFSARHLPWLRRDPNARASAVDQSSLVPSSNLCNRAWVHKRSSPASSSCCNISSTTPPPPPLTDMTEATPLPVRGSSPGDCAAGLTRRWSLILLQQTAAEEWGRPCPRWWLSPGARPDLPSGPAGWWAGGCTGPCWPACRSACRRALIWSGRARLRSSALRRSVCLSRSQGCSYGSCNKATITQ